jgi:hypothetical protein
VRSRAAGEAGAKAKGISVQTAYAFDSQDQDEGSMVEQSILKTVQEKRNWNPIISIDSLLHSSTMI